MTFFAEAYYMRSCHMVICKCISFFRKILTIKIIYSWRRTWRAAHESLTKSTVRHYHPILEKEAVLLAFALLSNPEAREKHFQRSAGSDTMSILYDYPTLETVDDKTLKEIHAFNDYVSEAAVPGPRLAELFPWMKHIPDRCVLVNWRLFIEC